jgi:general secretion pathway protein H
LSKAGAEQVPAPGAARLRRAHGASLIELLVVVVILGVLVGVAALGLSGAGDDRRIEREARRLEALLRLACERAELGGREHGVHFATGGYAFSTFVGGAWQPIKASELAARELDQGLVLSFARDQREARLPALPDAEPQALCSPEGELTPFVVRIGLRDAPAAWLVEAQEDGTLALSRSESGA